MVYQGNVDAGATYWSHDLPDGTPGDARNRVKGQFPDVMEKEKRIGFTDWIYNDPVVIAKGLKDVNVGKSKL